MPGWGQLLVRWLPEAFSDLDAVTEWLRAHAPEHLPCIAQQIWDGAQSLEKLPYRGRSGSVDGTREILIPHLPYKLVYTVRDADIHILRLLHQHRQWPPA